MRSGNFKLDKFTFLPNFDGTRKLKTDEIFVDVHSLVVSIDFEKLRSLEFDVSTDLRMLTAAKIRILSIFRTPYAEHESCIFDTLL